MGDPAKSWTGGSWEEVHPLPQPGIPEIGGWGGGDLQSSEVTLLRGAQVTGVLKVHLRQVVILLPPTRLPRRSSAQGKVGEG